ncbi:hypothetical protein Tco_1031177 [Tanacetum coccineum]|uniref:Uncharacterized protein n=1 Tax=Tanacetum coccineum TaxID=301880 RepID=A0ABQ5G9M9_9ASTR
MAVLESCPKHNMVAYLEKTDGNTDIHSIRSDLLFEMMLLGIDYLTKTGKIDIYCSVVHVEPQSDPSPRPSPTTHIPDSIPEDSDGNQGGQSSSDRSLSGNEGGMTLQSVYDLFSTEDVNTRVSTDKEEVSIDRPDEGTDNQIKRRYDPQLPPTTTTPLIFGDDETIAQPLPKIDPKDKGKKKIKEEDESDTESEGIPEAEKKFNQLTRDEEMARKYSEVKMEGIELILERFEDNDGISKLREMKTNLQEWGQFIQYDIVERRYPLSKDLMQRMLDFGLEVKIESTVALDLIRFIKQQLNEE